MDGKRYDELSGQEAREIETHYVCAQCWGPLTTLSSDVEKRLFKVICGNDCGEDRGFVRKEFAERRSAENSAEAMEARRNIGHLIGLPEREQLTKEKRDELIKEMWN